MNSKLYEPATPTMDLIAVVKHRISVDHVTYKGNTKTSIPIATSFKISATNRQRLLLISKSDL